MTLKLRVVTNSPSASGSTEDSLPVTVPVEWVKTVYLDDKPAPEILRGADVFIGTDFTVEMGAEADSLKAILVPAAGYDRIEPDAVPAGCVVANAYHHEAPIAEWVMAVAVMLDHNIIRADASMRRRSWDLWPARCGAYRELLGRTFGIIGFGNIGRRVAKLAAAYEMRVLASGRANTISGNQYGAQYIGGGGTAKDKVLAEADFVLISTPLNQHTAGIIGARELSIMKPTAYLINPARGHVIDESALYAALKNKQIAGAAIDTWYRYPATADDQPRPSDLPFWELNNIIMTPHHSGATDGTFMRRQATVAENIDRLARGEPLLNVIAELSKNE